MNKVSKYILLLLLIVVATSCESFLDKRPRNQWPVDNAMKTYDKAVQSVNGIYGTFMKGDALNMGLYSALITKSGYIDFMGANDYEMKYTQLTNSYIALSVWNACYHLINAANLSINGIPGIPDSSFPNVAEKEELIAEARMLRAYANATLLLNFGCWWDNDENPYGIIYRDQVTNASNINMPRVTVGESWKFIMDDINYAIEKMSDNFKTPRKVSKIFAKAYKAKLLLIRGTMRETTEDLIEAKNLLSEVLSNIPSSIQIDPDMAEHFRKSWDSKENIFVRYLEDVAGRTYDAGYYCEYNIAYSAYTNIKNSTGIDVTQKEAQCGVKYGLDWLREDPRWFIGTGRARKAETWDNTYCWTWTKIYRKGRFEGQQEPKDDKYAVYHMRLPELYIMMAELVARTGGTAAESISYINQMRSKRTNPVLEQLPVPASKEDLMETIYKEYICELIMENGTEYYTSIRFEKNGVKYVEVIKEGNVKFDKTKLQWPIPNDEMINNPLIKQNPNQE